jgi:hypothetical protein
MWLKIKVDVSLRAQPMELSEIADMCEAEARDANLSAVQIEQVAVLIRLSDDAAAQECAYWQRRAQRMRAAAATIRRLIGAKEAA